MAQYHDFCVIQISCCVVVFKPVKTVVQDFGTESGEGVVSSLTHMFPGCHCVILMSLFLLFLFISHVVREPENII